MRSHQNNIVHARHIGSQVWHEVSKGGLPGLELVVHDWPQEKLATLWNGLSALDIKTQLVPSSLRDGQFVVRALGGDDIFKIHECMNNFRGSLSLLAKQYWIDANTNGENLKCLPVGKLSPDETTKIQDALQLVGIGYSFSSSAEGDKLTIYREAHERVKHVAQWLDTHSPGL